MVILLTIIHVIICVFLVIVVLLQSGKAADLAGAFGGMGSQTAFGPRGGATLLSRATTIAAALFMVTSLTLAILATRGSSTTGSSVLDTAPVTQKSPAQPAIPSGPGTGLPSGQPGVTVVPESGGKPITIPLPAPGQAPPASKDTAPAKPAPAPAKK